MSNPKLLAIDPGNFESGYVIYNGSEIIDAGVSDNEDLLQLVKSYIKFDSVAIEKPEARMNPLGKTLLETIFWTGRFYQASTKDKNFLVEPCYIRQHHCGRPNSNDKAVTQSLLKKYRSLIRVHGESKGEFKANYLLQSHELAAFALATYIFENKLLP